MITDKSLDTFFFWNSGAEAVEAAIKLARMATGRQNVIVMQGSYHGRTFGTMAMTKSKTVYSAGFAPWMVGSPFAQVGECRPDITLQPGVLTAPFPYWRQLGLQPDASEKEMADACLYQLELLLAQQTAPRDTAALILEPVLCVETLYLLYPSAYELTSHCSGEGGYVPSNKHFLEGLQKICNREGIMFIIDEVRHESDAKKSTWLTFCAGSIWLWTLRKVLCHRDHRAWPAARHHGDGKGYCERESLKRNTGSVTKEHSSGLPTIWHRDEEGACGQAAAWLHGRHVRWQCSQLCCRSGMRKSYEGGSDP